MNGWFVILSPAHGNESEILGKKTIGNFESTNLRVLRFHRQAIVDWSGLE
jgi:hypothetical protein